MSEIVYRSDRVKVLNYYNRRYIVKVLNFRTGAWTVVKVCRNDAEYKQVLRKMNEI